MASVSARLPRYSLMMKMAVLLSVSSLVDGAPRAVCPTQPVEAVEGDDVTLQFRLDPRVDLSDRTVDWKRGHGVVHSYRHRRDRPVLQTGRYRNRTSLDHEDLSGGVVTLRISSVQLNDSGQYAGCVSKLNACCKIDLAVVGKDRQDETTSTAGPAEEEVTGDPDAAQMEAGRRIAVLVVAAVVAAAAACVIFILVKLGKIQICKNALGGLMRPEVEMVPNDSEMQNLGAGATEGGADHDGAAENGLRESADARVLVGREETEG